MDVWWGVCGCGVEVGKGRARYLEPQTPTHKLQVALTGRLCLGGGSEAPPPPPDTNFLSNATGNKDKHHK